MPDKNIDKDIERCKELIKEEHSNWIGLTNQDAIYNVLFNLENYRGGCKKLTCEKDAYIRVCNELKSELETYKKIAEKLAGVLGKRGIVTLQPIPPYNDNALLETVVINGKDEIINWAKSEVLKDE